MRRYLTEEEKVTVYPKLFLSVFGEQPDKQPPRQVIVYEKDGKIESFLSCYTLTSDTLYCAHVGVVNQQQGDSWQLDRLYGFMYDQGIRWLCANVENTNVVCQRMLLTKGWLAHGVRVVKNKVFVEYYKELKLGG